MTISLVNLSDPDLLSRLRELVQKSNTTTATLIAHIGEVDARKPYGPESALLGDLGLSPTLRAW